MNLLILECVLDKDDVGERQIFFFVKTFFATIKVKRGGCASVSMPHE